MATEANNPKKEVKPEPPQLDKDKQSSDSKKERAMRFVAKGADDW